MKTPVKLPPLLRAANTIQLLYTVYRSIYFAYWQRKQTKGTLPWGRDYLRKGKFPSFQQGLDWLSGSVRWRQ